MNSVGIFGRGYVRFGSRCFGTWRRSGACGFVLLADFFGVPADPEQIHHDRGKGDKPYGFDDLLRIAKMLGLIARPTSPTS